MRTRLSSETLVWARQSSGFAVSEIAKSAGVSDERYQEWETGDDRPTFRQLRQLANKLKRPVALFYLASPPTETAMPPDFRIVHGIRQSSYPPDLRLEIRKANRLQLLLGVLSEELDLIGAAAFPKVTHGTDVDEAAALIRRHLGLSVERQLEIGNPEDLYREWREAIFATGVIPIQFGVEREYALGFALWHDYAPLIAVNTRQAAEAKTFTLLHELAHIALRMSGVSDASIPYREIADENSHAEVESYCNRVAAAVLLPADSANLKDAIVSLTQGGRLNLDSFRKQARRFGVSKYALAFRLAAIKPEYSERVQSTVSSWFAIDSAKKAPVKKSKGGPTPALTTLGRRGRGFSKVVLSAVRDSRISTEDARDLLDLEPHHFPKLEEYVFRGENDVDGGAE